MTTYMMMCIWNSLQYENSSRRRDMRNTETKNIMSALFDNIGFKKLTYVAATLYYS